MSGESPLSMMRSRRSTCASGRASARRRPVSGCVRGAGRHRHRRGSRLDLGLVSTPPRSPTARCPAGSTARQRSVASMPAARRASAAFRSASSRTAIRPPRRSTATSRRSTYGPPASPFPPSFIVRRCSHGEITGPVTLADPGQPPVFVANWSRAQIRPARHAARSRSASPSALHQPRFDRVAGPGTGMIFQADQRRVDGPHRAGLGARSIR